MEGSGGSIHIHAGSISGYGALNVSGGIGTTSGGGGGRLSLYVSGSYGYEGTFHANGGSGGIRGSSGSVFLQRLTDGTLSTSLIIAGESLQPTTTSNLGLTELDELHVIDSGIIAISSRLNVSLLVSDGTGKLVLMDRGALTVQNVIDSNLGTQCRFEVQEGAEFVVNSDLYLTGISQPLLELKGNLTANSITVGEGGELVISRAGKLVTSRILVHRLGQVTLAGGGEILKNPSQISQNGIINLDLLAIGPGGRFTVEVETQLIIDMLTLRYGSSLTSTAPLYFTTNTTTIESSTLVSVNGGGLINGYGSPGHSNSGASHGGEGASIQGSTGKGLAYGSPFQPKSTGSGVNAVRGGGIISFVVSESLILGGVISANGESSNLGGASGGSIYINAAQLSGHGSLSANGGDGGSSCCGGGGGGRIAIDSPDSSDFAGIFTTYGGNGLICGAAGTIFTQTNEQGFSTQTLIVDNRDLATNFYTVFMSNADSSEVSLDKLIVRNSGRLQLADRGPISLTVSNLDGDLSGTILVKANQTLSVATRQAVTSYYTLQSALVVEKEGEIIIPSNLYLHQVTHGRSLHLAGLITGAKKLLIGSNADVWIEPTASTAILSNGNYIFIDPPGTFTLDSMLILGYGHLTFETSLDQPTLLNILNEIHVRFSGSLQGRWLLLDAKQVHVEYTGSITSDGMGYPASAGPGAGLSNPTGGSGGSHGGVGGQGSGNAQPILASYGSLYETRDFGSGGGNSRTGRGGAGGGVIEINVDTFRLDGSVSSSGSQSECGGGSGGAVHILILSEFTGSGQISVVGGESGMAQCGGGGGGRVTIITQHASRFTGTYLVHGGSAAASAQPGGSGTAYIKQITGATDFTKLFINNEGTGITSPQLTLLNETEIKEYIFDELHVLNNVILEVAGVNRSMTVTTLISDVTSMVKVHDTMTLRVSEGQADVSLACTFQLDPEGELSLPARVTFLGPKNVFSGLSKFISCNTLGNSPDLK